MQITFLRRGFANNSSSSHSLILVKDIDNISTSEDNNFGWDYFTVADKKAKKNYLLHCLKSSFRYYLKLTANYDLCSWELRERFIKNLFFVWTDKYNIALDPAFDYDDGGVDHQSIIYLPLYRCKDEINIEFFKAFNKHVLENNFVILGGNDNDESEHPLLEDDIKTEESAFKTLWRELKDYNNAHGRIEKDNLTGEWVLCKPSGFLMKFKF